MPVTFDEHKMYNRQPPQTVERAIQTYAAWSDIHETEFLDTYYDASLTIPGGGGQWNAEEYNDDIPYNILIEYHTIQDGHGVIVRKDSEGNKLSFTIYDGESQCGYYEAENDLWHIIHSKPVTAPEEADVSVAFREQRFSDDPDDVWVSISIWMNDALIDTYLLFWGTPMTGDIKFGLYTYGSHELTNVRIPQLTEFAEWSSLDPGEFTLGGMQRALEGRYVKYFIRFNGSMKAWRRTQVNTEHTYSNDNIWNIREAFDIRQFYNHVRMMGAYDHAEYVRYDLVGKYGHKFLETNNPFLMSPAECLREAEREIDRMEEKAFSLQIASACRPHLEPEDRITVDGKEWIIERFDRKFGPGLIEDTVYGRKYTY